jgi:multimeric flavodoxin WrbA
MKIDKKTLDRFRLIRGNTIKQAKELSHKKGKIKVLGISGSARSRFDMAGEDSNSEFLLNECLKEHKKLGTETELIPLRDYNLQHCKACYSTTNTQCHFYCSCYPKGSPTEDDMTKIMYDKILAADIIIFATPVNNFKISSMMALFLDRCISLDGSLEPADPKASKNVKLNIEHTKFVESHADQKTEGSGFFRRFRGKVAGIIVTGHEEGASMVISQLFMTLNHFGMIFCPWSNMYAMSSILNPTFKDKKIVNSKT